MEVADMEIIPDSLDTKVQSDNAAHPKSDSIEQVTVDPNLNTKTNLDDDCKDAGYVKPDNEQLKDFTVLDVDDGCVEKLDNGATINTQEVCTAVVGSTKTDNLNNPSESKDDKVIPDLENETQNSGNPKSTNEEPSETLVDNPAIDISAVKAADTEKVCDSLILTVDELENEEMSLPEKKRKVASGASDLKKPLIDNLDDGKSRALETKNGMNVKNDEKASETVNNNCDHVKNKTKEFASKANAISSRIVWVSNITHFTKASELKQFLSKMGKVITAKIVSDGRKCYGYIIMENAEDAARSVKALNNSHFEGRKIALSFRKPHKGLPENITKNRSKSAKEDVTDHVKVKAEVASKADSKKMRKSRSKSVSEELSKRRASNDPLTKRYGFKRRHRSRSTRATNGSSNKTRINYLDETEERERLRRRLLDEQRRSREEILRQIHRDQERREATFRLEQERRRLQLEKELFYKERKELSRIDAERKRIERERLEIMEQRKKLQEEMRKNAMKAKAEGFARSSLTGKSRKDLGKDENDNYRTSGNTKDMFRKLTKENRDENKINKAANIRIVQKNDRIDFSVKEGGKTMKPFNDRFVPPPPKLTDDFDILAPRTVRHSDGSHDYCDGKYCVRKLDRGGRKIEVIDRKSYTERTNENPERKNEQRVYRKLDFDQRKPPYMVADRKYEFGREGKRYRNEPYLKRDQVDRTHWPAASLNYNDPWKSAQAGPMSASSNVRIQEANFGGSSYGGGHPRIPSFYFPSLSAGEEFQRYQNSTQTMGRKYV